MDKTDVIRFDEQAAKDFRAAYHAARDKNRAMFLFQGKEVLVSYAKYLDEYLVLRGLLPKEKTL